MTTRRIAPLLLITLVCALCLGAIAGCAPAEQQDDAAKNRAYMSQANTIMMRLNADLEPFTAAVAAEDVVSMEQAAANVYRDIDSFKNITAPELMKDIHAEYCAGCDDLKQALQSYVALYKDAANTEASEINAAVAEIQKQYDSAIAHLQAADKKVTELNGALPTESSSASESPASTESAESTESSKS
ncbi:MAG: DUF6376 family protein [Coriobacteriia bacterium]|nr:DUF6376 family protein [Coriobacteriia bacterium]